MHIVLSIFDHALSLSGFVLCMMLLVEYFHSSSRTTFMKILKVGGLGSYLLAASLGAIPGCFGCFLVVTCYIHGINQCRCACYGFSYNYRRRCVCVISSRYRFVSEATFFDSIGRPDSRFCCRQIRDLSKVSIRMRSITFLPESRRRKINNECNR